MRPWESIYSPLFVSLFTHPSPWGILFSNSFFQKTEGDRAIPSVSHIINLLYEKTNQMPESNRQNKGHRKSQPDFFSLTAWSEQDSNLHIQCADLLCHLLKESNLVMPKSLRVNLFATAPGSHDPTSRL